MFRTRTSPTTEASLTYATLHVLIDYCVYSCGLRLTILTICLLGVACSRRYPAGPCEIPAIRRIQQINTAEAQFMSEHQHFGGADELALPELESPCEIAYRYTIQLRRNGYAVEARPRE